MDAGAGRQVEADDDVVDELGDAVGTEETRLELVGGRLGKGRRRPLPEPKEGPVAHLVLDVTMSLVVVELLSSLSLLQPVADIS